jgi:hypothetical protein
VPEVNPAGRRARDDQGYWRQIEQYISDHSEAQYSYGICQECANLLYPELYSDKAIGA